MKHLTRIFLIIMVLSLALCANIGTVWAEGNAASTTAPQQTPDALVRKALQDELDAFSAKQKGAWIKEILASTALGDFSIGAPDKKGAIPVMFQVTYPTLASGVDPKSTFDGKDATAFVSAALKNATEEMVTYEVSATVAFAEGKDPSIKWDAKKGVAGLEKALTAQAKAATASFANKPMLAAMTSFVLSHPARITKLDLTGGPHAMKLTATAPDFDRMHRYALRSALTRTAYEAQGPKTTIEELSRIFDEQIAAFGTLFQKAKKAKNDSTVSLSFDPWELAKDASSNQSVQDYREAYDTSRSDFVLALDYLAPQLPDAPALEMPQTGRLEGGDRGTKVVIRATKGDGNCMVRFLKDGEVKALCFIRDGEKLNIHLPAGTYDLQMGSGNIWYGNDELFGPDTITSYSFDSVRIPGPDYYYVVTFSTGDADSKDAMDDLSRDDFKK